MASEIGQFQKGAKIYQNCFNRAATTKEENRVDLFKQFETTYQQLKVQGKELTRMFASSFPEQKERFSTVMKGLKELHRRQKALPTAQFLKTFAAYQGYLKQLKAPQTPDQISLFERCEAIYQQLKAEGKEIRKIVSNFSVKQQQNFSNMIADLKALHTEQKALKPAGSHLPNLVLEEKWGDVRNTLLAEATRAMIPNLAHYTSLEIAFLLLIKTKDPKRCEEYKTNIRSLILAGHRSELALEMAIIENLTEFVQSLLKAGVVPTEEIVSLAFLGHYSSSYAGKDTYARRLLIQAGLIGKKDHFYKNYSNKTPENLLKSLIQDSSQKPKNLVFCILRTSARTSLLELAANCEVQFTHDDLNVAIKNHANLEQLELLISQGLKPTDDNLRTAIETKRVDVIKFILQTGITPTEEHVKLAIECGGEDEGWGSKNTGEGIIALIEAGAPRTLMNYLKACKRGLFKEDVLAALKPDAVDPT